MKLLLSAYDHSGLSKTVSKTASDTYKPIIVVDFHAYRPFFSYTEATLSETALFIANPKNILSGMTFSNLLNAFYNITKSLC